MPDMIFRADRPALGEVERFKQTLSHPLPNAYDAFLASFNGGRPACQLRYVPELEGLVEIDILFGVGLGEAFDIKYWTDEFADELPVGTLVIGGDPLGNLFTLDLATGAVYYWDQVRQYERSDHAENVFLVANDVDKFLEDETDSDEPLLSNLFGPDGPKVPENIWYHAEDGTMQEFERTIYIAQMHLKGYAIAATVA